MNWTPIKSTSEATLEGVELDWEVQHKDEGMQIVRMVLNDEVGHILMISRDFHGLCVSTPTPPTVTKWQVAGRIKSLDFLRVHQDEECAKAEALKLTEEFKLTPTALTVKPVSVPNI